MSDAGVLEGMITSDSDVVAELLQNAIRAGARAPAATGAISSGR